MLRYALSFLLLLSSYLALFAAHNKVLVVSSYGTDFQWSNAIMDAIGHSLKETHPTIEFRREFLSSEMLSDSMTLGESIQDLLKNYQQNPPKAIILISDEAWMAYLDAKTSAFKDVPLILCAVKPHTIKAHEFKEKRDSLKLSDFSSTADVIKKYNGTAIIRKVNVTGSLSLIENLIEDLNRFVFITDKRFYGVYVQLLLQEEATRRYPKIPVEYIDGRFTSTDSMLTRLPQVPPTAGVLMTSWLTGEYGFEYSKDNLYSLMENKLQTPIFITADIGLDKEYFVGGYFNDSHYWGEKTADILEMILNGVNPKNIDPETFSEDECNISWKVFHHYRLNTSRLPARVIYYNAPKSFWYTYRYYIMVLVVVLLVFLMFYLYTLYSNIKLQRTQRLLLKSINEKKIANIELKQTHEKLLVALKKAEESDHLKSAFLANMSHEIRTPLNAIVGFSSILNDTDSEEERNEFVALIQSNSDLLLRLISDILDISRIEAGVLEFNISKCDALDVCNNVITSLQSKCKHGVKLLITPSVAPMELYTDSNRLMQMLINLVNNAIKFTSQGSIEVGYFYYDENTVEFYVKDTGIGISPDKLEAVFDRFTKINSFIEGTGLGLSICKTIVNTLGGEIGVESELGVGSRFWFRIQKHQSEIK